MDINLTEIGKFSIGALCFVICVYLICRSKWTGPIEAVKLAVSYLTSIGTRIKNILKHIAYRQLYNMDWFFRETGYGNLHDFLTELRDTARAKHVSANKIMDFIEKYETSVDSTGFDFLHRCIRIAKKHSTTIHTLLEQLYKHIETYAETKYSIEELSDNDRDTLISDCIISDCTKLIDSLQGFAESINEHHIQVLLLY